MSTKPISVSPQVTLQQAAATMREHDVGSVIVKENDELLGIVTHWDMVQRAMAEGVDTSTVLVKDLMVRDLITVHPSLHVFDALRLMNEVNIRHLPVLEENKLVGFVTMKDLLKIQPQLLELLSEKKRLQF